MDRGIDYSDLVDFLSNSNITNLICMPTTGYKIGEQLKEITTNKKGKGAKNSLALFFC
jgi:hypothetical protein